MNSYLSPPLPMLMKPVSKSGTPATGYTTHQTTGSAILIQTTNAVNLPFMSLEFCPKTAVFYSAIIGNPTLVTARAMICVTHIIFANYTGPASRMAKSGHSKCLHNTLKLMKQWTKSAVPLLTLSGTATK